jgi:formylglycine-generating enzyme required for sulfatase activity
MKRFFAKLLVALSIATPLDFAVADPVPDSFRGTYTFSSGLNSIMENEASPVEGGVARVLRSDSIGRVGQDGSVETLRQDLDITHIKVTAAGLKALTLDEKNTIAAMQEAISDVEQPFLDKGTEILFNQAVKMPDAEMLIIAGQKAGLGNIDIMSLVTKVGQKIQWIEFVIVSLNGNQTKLVQIFDATQNIEEHGAPQSVQLPDEFTNSIGMSFKLIPAGEFVRSPASKEDPNPLKVKLTKPFYMAIYEVEQWQGLKVVGFNPSHKKGLQNPVEMVSWNEAVAFCKLISEIPEEKAAGRVYRLPTEMEWEYACRGGADTTYSFGNNLDVVGDYAWYAENSGRKTHPVGQKLPNAYGLYDMHGNVSEWCNDWYGMYDNPGGILIDPVGPDKGSERALRGNAFPSNTAVSFLPKARHRLSPTFRTADIGFRVAMSATGGNN